MPPHRRYPTPGRESHESLSILVLQGQDTRRHEERMVTLAGHCGKGTPKLVRRSSARTLSARAGADSCSSFKTSTLDQSAGL
jgi:hypothetical protein